ncbi:MAG: hypothetical protein OXN15_06050 [Chloroflexota bacterium]|nr:hypothetical protein [Chloroflexota bacterium]MDE2970520.1 hypothetical protein [Chloroflexota bacterium]
MAESGVKVSLGSGGTRIELECEHQSGVLYTVPGEMSWVCTPEMLHAHALAGFMRELVKLESPAVEALMQRWGVYYRERPVTAQAAGDAEEGASEA